VQKNADALGASSRAKIVEFHIGGSSCEDANM